MSQHTLVVGLGITGQAVVRALQSRQESVRVVDDHPTELSRETAKKLNVDYFEAPQGNQWAELLNGCRQVVVSPGLPDAHPVFTQAKTSHVPILDEFDLAQAWDDRPCCAVTGTNGKTTVVTLVVNMLAESGIKACAVGNTEIPLVAALDDQTIERFVLEASSFRLAHTQKFSAHPAAWLNFAPDHLDLHQDLAAYQSAKARIWEGLKEPSQAIANLADPVVAIHTPKGATSFGTSESTCRVENGWLVFEDQQVVAVNQLPRRFPHDLANAQAALALAMRFGASVSGCEEALRTFTGLPHRMQVVGEINRVTFINDSKATTPHAVMSAAETFSDLTLLVGGRNKGVNLSPLGALTPSQVVAFGEAAKQMAAVFEKVCPVAVVGSLEEAVTQAIAVTKTPGTILLSPGGTSFDQYDSYSQRGEEFIRLVQRYKEAMPA